MSSYGSDDSDTDAQPSYGEATVDDLRKRARRLLESTEHADDLDDLRQLLAKEFLGKEYHRSATAQSLFERAAEETKVGDFHSACNNAKAALERLGEGVSSFEKGSEPIDFANGYNAYEVRDKRTQEVQTLYTRRILQTDDKGSDNAMTINYPYRAFVPSRYVGQTTLMRSFTGHPKMVVEKSSGKLEPHTSKQMISFPYELARGEQDTVWLTIDEPPRKGTTMRTLDTARTNVPTQNHVTRSRPAAQGTQSWTAAGSEGMPMAFPKPLRPPPLRQQNGATLDPSQPTRRPAPFYATTRQSQEPSIAVPSSSIHVHRRAMPRPISDRDDWNSQLPTAPPAASSPDTDGSRFHTSMMTPSSSTQSHVRLRQDLSEPQYISVGPVPSNLKDYAKHLPPAQYSQQDRLPRSSPGNGPGQTTRTASSYITDGPDQIITVKYSRD